ncbi:hypothetical protein FDECE_12816 [Fusarium decemcellulare]|nr:hypothetical protein FDECE_12816 [Fusarium decemcellulare]
MDTQQEPPTVACLRCPPPDRKRLALARAQERTSQPVDPLVRRSINSPGLPTAQGLDHHDSLPPTRDSPAWSDREGTTGDGRSLLGPVEEMRVSSFGQHSFPVVDVSREVAFFLFEIFFERHYQSSLLFRKKTFIESYVAGKACSYVVHAIFAFASLFLHPNPGGICRGSLDITEVSLVDWQLIGRLWGEQASQLALMTADKPCLDLVQACQVLALFWYLTSLLMPWLMVLIPTAAIAYRASRLLQFDQVRLNDPVERMRERGHQVTCFWACWLTKCASVENSRFEIDCWVCVEGCPLPSDGFNQDEASDILACSLGEDGSLAQPEQGIQLSFNSVLVVVQGLWWECQRFAREVHGERGHPEQWAAKYCSLDQRLQSLPDQLAKYRQPILATPMREIPSSELSRTFSLVYMYELCLLYLHSSVVPVLSCRVQTPAFSRSMLQLAAEQAWEHSRRMTQMTEQYISSKSSISKLWPIVGYGAYVCAAVQLRRCLALGLLSLSEIQITRINLRLAAELCKYWSHLRPVFEDMERQFGQATALATSQEVERPREHRQGRGDSLIVNPDTHTSPALSSHIRTYVANDERSDQLEETGSMPGSSAAADQINSTPSLPALDPRSASAAIPSSVGDVDSMLVDPVGDGWEMRLDPIWWSQNPEEFGELFGSGCLLLDDVGNSINLC